MERKRRQQHTHDECENEMNEMNEMNEIKEEHEMNEIKEEHEMNYEVGVKKVEEKEEPIVM